MSRDNIPVPALGAFDLDSLQLDYEAIGIGLRRFVVQGSNSGQLAASDLTMVNRSRTPISDLTTVRAWVDAGTKLLDAIVYLSLPTDRRPAVDTAPDLGEVVSTSHADLARAVFYVYMFIMIRGRAPLATDSVSVGSAPGFLTSVMKLQDRPDMYATRIASFDINKLDYAWIKCVHIPALQPKVRNRLALGIAGYRAIAAVKMVRKKDGLSQAQQDAVSHVVRFFDRGIVWDCVAVTRSELFIQRFGNFNGCLYNLLHEICADGEVERLKKNKIIPEAVEDNMRHTGWTSWTWSMFDDLRDFVFTDNADQYAQYQ